MTMPSPRLVDSQPELQQLCAHVRSLDRVGLDTEFHAERRYRPELMLIQIADDQGGMWVADPKALDLRPLAAALSGRTWVAFAAETDVSLLGRLGGRPRALHDPQRLAGLAGHEWPRSLADLCKAELGVTLDKAPALSDWSRRPLNATQLRYAADDARMAMALWDALVARTRSERVDWAIEDGEAVLGQAADPVDPDARWLRMRIAPRLDEQARAAMQRLSAWRDAEAQAADQPPWSILPDAHLLDLARRQPSSLGALHAHRRMNRGKIRKYGEQWLRLIHAPPDDGTPPAPPADRAVRESILAIGGEAIGRTHGVAPGLLFTAFWRDRVLREGPSALRGWRATLAADSLEALLAGRAVLSAAGWRPTLGPR